MAFSRDQTFSAGNSATSMDQAGWNPAGSQPGGDPLYPYLVYADEVHVTSNKLTKWSSGDWGNMDWWEAEFGDEVSGLDVWWHAQKFMYRVTVDVKAAALAACVYCPSFLQSADNTGPIYDNAAGLSLFKVSGAVWGLELFYRSWTTGTEFVQTYTFPIGDISDENVVLTLTGCCGTPTLAGSAITAVAADGYIMGQISINGASATTAYNITGLDLYVSGSHNNRLRGYVMGSGIPGDISSILTTGDSTCATIPLHSGDSIPCCVDTAPGGSSPPGNVGTNPDPVGPFPPFLEMCEGDGSVDAVALLVDGESYA